MAVKVIGRDVRYIDMANIPKRGCAYGNQDQRNVSWR